MKQPPRAIQQQLAEAIALLQRRDFAAAQAGFLAILNRDPRNFDALHYAGVAAAQAGRLEEGAAIAAALQHHPHRLRGEPCLQLGDRQDQRPLDLTLDPDGPGVGLLGLVGDLAVVADEELADRRGVVVEQALRRLRHQGTVPEQHQSLVFAGILEGLWAGWSRCGRRTLGTGRGAQANAGTDQGQAETGGRAQ